jgi:hypothetical protein
MLLNWESDTGSGQKDKIVVATGSEPVNLKEEMSDMIPLEKNKKKPGWENSCLKSLT